MNHSKRNEISDRLTHGMYRTLVVVVYDGAEFLSHPQKEISLILPAGPASNTSQELRIALRYA